MLGAQEALIDQLRELQAGEKALVKALPKLVLAGSSVQFRSLVATHLKETEGQLDRLARMASQLGVSLEGGQAGALEPLIGAARKVMAEDAPALVKDRHLIEAARAIERAEAEGYRRAYELAEECDQSEALQPLQKTLGEEEAADRLLTTLAEEIDAGAVVQQPPA